MILTLPSHLPVARLLGVDRVVIYNTSCGPDLDRLLRGYIKEGFVELVPWPIDKHLIPSYGWLFSQSGGDVHYFGQQTTLNECIYRSMARSRYVLLNDIDEIIMPYQHNDLLSLMNMLQQQQPNVRQFRCARENEKHQKQRTLDVYECLYFPSILFCRQGCSSWKTISSQRNILSRAASFTCRSGTESRELICWSISTGKNLTEVFTTHTSC